MREQMIYNPGIYQLRETALQRMLEIIHQRKEAIPGGIVFFGDSLTEFCDLEAYYPFKNIYNCGIAGASIEELTWIADEAVIKYQPSLVVLMAGINDMGNTVMSSPRNIARDMDLLVRLITRNLPETQVLLLSPIPCLSEYQDYHHVAGIRCNAFVSQVNDLYQEIIKDSHVTLLNPFPLFMENGEERKDYYQDGLHLNDLGYQLLTNFVESHIEKK